ncbi:MAG: AraC family transcriptional regulator [Lachnospiraceae bacterium]|nr:AraC family transcriptional regulator [Lachnospiraceae bacterium]
MNDEKVLEKVVSYIDQHIGEDLSLDKIAEALNYSKFYMARTFAEKTGCTIYKYIQGQRLTLAARELVETKKPIIDIAYEAHYNSQQAFTLAFSRLYQCSPQTYRKNGVFYPIQTKITLRGQQYRSGATYRMGGEMAA